ncbi:1-deoxy-D-xylulose-5-phosphate synthase [Actinomadura litoris]|uniref:1-deoxy-D-xylulose-5-phosphate synthase n=1 Tax=Actinomadura litoris TaxID=2678616 RepID=A0A7K1KW77_9ACTN|nr:1-deoxy-D-xylulose-5-phosphate synthase [Actinomadura litoris]MUN36206.1 1-deoxy-D-xylulose-5-phosphate synthase [Actinomadura litoris]
MGPEPGRGGGTPLLDRVHRPADLRGLDGSTLAALAAEIREFLIAEVSRSGGHLGPNLGAVELTIALHRVFESPRDRILWDTGHQAYVHKLLTGRKDFSRLRAKGGLSGYPSRAESEHDLIENSHASTALGWADGLAKAYRLAGRTDRRVVAVVGDGALTGGMVWEGLNSLVDQDLRVVVVVNDNGRSYAPTRGGLARHLSARRTAGGYERMLARAKRLREVPVAGAPLYGALHGVKAGIKDVLAPQGLFQDLGVKYVGPVDGHDIAATEEALRQAARFDGPVVVHCVTRKGNGFAAAEQDELDQMHVVRPRSADGAPPPADWTSVFAEEMVRIGAERPEVVAVTAAMLEPVGLQAFAERYPDRVFDVGIAEQHAVTSAAGLSAGGAHPVVALYATFLNRAFDQVLMDVALHGCGVTFALDRAGVTGSDGPSHNGMWDLSMLQLVPGMRIAAPRDGARLRAQLREAVAVEGGPTAVRYPKGPVAADIEPVGRAGAAEILALPDGPGDVLIVAVGPMAAAALGAAGKLAAEGVAATVVDPCWVKPLDTGLLTLAEAHELIVTVEDNGRVAGVGAALAQAMRDAGIHRPLRQAALPQEFLAQAGRGEVLEQAGLTAQGIARDVTDALARLRATDQEEEIL